MFRVFFLVVTLSVPVVAQDPAAAGHGEEVFLAQKCNICHSVAEKGNTKGPLDGVGSRLSPGDVREWITNAPVMAAKARAERTPPMKAFTGIVGKDLDDLVAYLQTLKER
jgi:mono/diheme cytochrome c family protein